jgi:rhamnogalacturonan endolyase
MLVRNTFFVFAVMVMFCALIFILNAKFREPFFQANITKHGNNGTVSCQAFCTGPWDSGPKGGCVKAYDTNGKRYIDCNSVRGLGAEVTCECLPAPVSTPVTTTKPPLTDRQKYELASFKLRNEPYPPPYADIQKSIAIFDKIKADTQFSSLKLVTYPSKAMSIIGSNSVTLANVGEYVTIDNGILKCTFSKQKFKITSMFYRGVPLSPSSKWNNWNFNVFPDSYNSDFRVTIDPKDNSGQRAEIAFFVTSIPHMKTIPKFDMEIRYAMERGLSGVYTSLVMSRKKEWQTGVIGEARYLLCIDSDMFDYLTLHSERRQIVPKVDDLLKPKFMNMFEAMLIESGPYAGKVEDKYDYSEFMTKLPAYGWTSTSHGIGVWFINPSQEYISGGPTKVNLTSHRAMNTQYDFNEATNKTTVKITPQDNVMLNMWCGGHYGGPSLALNDDFTKVIGPFLIYVNGDKKTHDALYQDAVREAERQQQLWPFEFFKHPAFKAKSERGTVSGVLKTDIALSGDVWAGLVDVAVAYWELDANKNQFWARINVQKGMFTIMNVPEGIYKLVIIGKGLWGEHVVKNVKVEKQKQTNIGEIIWNQQKPGKTILWQIGEPTRNSTKFKNGDLPKQWGVWYLQNKQFPDGCKFVVGKSKEQNDWNYCQTGRVDDKGLVSDSKWTIEFQGKKGMKGTATVRFAFCGWTKGLILKIHLNKMPKPIGEMNFSDDNMMLFFNGTSGRWTEKSITFDAAGIQEGSNIISITLTAAKLSWWTAVHYDSIKLEIDAN